MNWLLGNADGKFMQKIIVLKQMEYYKDSFGSGFGFFHDGVYLEEKSEHHHQGGKSDSAETEYYLFVENIRI